MQEPQIRFDERPWNIPSRPFPPYSSRPVISKSKGSALLSSVAASCHRTPLRLWISQTPQLSNRSRRRSWNIARRSDTRMIMATIPHRKLWICEAGSTATSVPVQAGELVEDIKTLVLSRYANSLGKALDPAHMNFTITPRVRGPPSCHERFLSPDEDVYQLLDSYYPGGQKLI